MKVLFIAYNHKDKVVARFIYHNLLNESWEDVEVFMDEFSIQPGEDIKEKCLERAKIADLGIVVLSEYTQKSEFVPQEVGILLSRDIPKIYVALHENWEIPPGYEKTIRSFPLFEEKNPSEGMDKLTELVRDIIKPKEIGAVELINKAGKLGDQGKFKEALKYAERAIRVDPSYDWAYLSKIGNLRRLGRYKEALQVINETLAIFPNHVKVLHYKAFLLYSMKKFPQAVKNLDKILNLTDGLDQGALFYKGRCLVQMKNFDEAIEAFDACQKIDPASTHGKEALYIKSTLKNKKKGERT